MKRFLSLLLVFVLLSSVSVAFADDYSSMNDEELKEAYNSIRKELAVRDLIAKKKTVIYDEPNVLQIYLNGDIEDYYIAQLYSWDDYYSLFIPVVIVNNTKYTIRISIKNASLNGWSTNGEIVYSTDPNTTIPAGKKDKSYLVFNISSTDIKEINDFENAEFSLNIFDDDNWDNDIIKLSRPISIIVK